MSGVIDGIYELIINARNYLYDVGILKTYWVDAPVIAVGNLTVGGTGKTPTVISLANISKELGAKPGIILRGYGGSAERESDETMLFQRRLKDTIIIANKNRVSAANIAMEKGADILIADDAFQHRKLGRDINICLIDATFPFGGERLLPIGRLREPIDAIRRADLIIITRVDQIPKSKLDEIIERIKSIANNIPILQSQHKANKLSDIKGTQFQVDMLDGKKVYLFSAIARPESFEKTIMQLGANIVGTKRFKDHHFFDKNDLLEMKSQADNTNADYIICTEKDIVKLNDKLLAAVGIKTSKLYALEIEIQFLNNGMEILRKKTEILLNNFSRDILKRICTNK